MSGELTENLADEAQLALAYIGPNLRDALRIFLELDGRLARIVSATTEPMLGQMRLAWWRDALGMAVSERPQGDAVLDGIGNRQRFKNVACHRPPTRSPRPFISPISNSQNRRPRWLIPYPSLPPP